MVINFSKEISPENLGDFMVSVAQYLISYDDQGTFNKFTLGCGIDNLELPTDKYYVTEEGGDYYVTNVSITETVIQAAPIEQQDEDEDEGPHVEIISKYNALESHRNVSAVISNGNLITIVTNKIEAEGHDLGRYAIILDTDEEQVRIEINSLDYMYFSGEVSACHPHINSEGDACYGNLEHNIVLAANEHDIPALGLLLVEFLSSVNLDDSWGRRVEYWPEV